MTQYRRTMDTNAQAAGEHWITVQIMDTYPRETDEASAKELARQILLEVLKQFRPDLVESTAATATVGVGL
jgi:hypothetical protein